MSPKSKLRSLAMLASSIRSTSMKGAGLTNTKDTRPLQQGQQQHELQSCPEEPHLGQPGPQDLVFSIRLHQVVI